MNSIEIDSSDFQSTDREQLFEFLIDMSVIIYDITQDPTQVITRFSFFFHSTFAQSRTL